MRVIKLGKFRILNAAANGKSQYRVCEDALLGRNDGYRLIKELRNAGVIKLDGKKKNKYEFDGITMFHHNLGETVVNMAEREDAFFEDLGKGKVIRPYLPLILMALMKPSIDAFFADRNYRIGLDDVEKFADILKTVIFLKIREEGGSDEMKKVIAYLESLGKDIEKLPNKGKDIKNINGLMKFAGVSDNEGH
jgi:hypothetical protein